MSFSHPNSRKWENFSHCKAIYDREANIKIISYSDGTYTQNIDQESVIFDDYAADSGYKEGASWLELDLGPKVAFKKEIEFTPVVVNLLKKEAAAGTICSRRKPC